MIITGGDIVAPQSGIQQGRLQATDLQKASAYSRDPITVGFRPDWVAQNAFPQSLPQRRRVDLSFALDGLNITIERDELVSTDYPWCTIGRVFIGASPDLDHPKESGTGVLVGPNLMLTASHIAPWGVDGWWMRFVPSYRDGSGPFGDSFVSQFRGHWSDESEYDYIICQLYTDLGNRAGWMGTWASTDDSFYEDSSWTSVGYPGNYMRAERPVVEWSVQPDDAEAGDGTSVDFEPPFTSPGWSGGPIFGWVEDQPRVVGVNRGEESSSFLWWSDEDSVFSGGMHMVDLVKYGLANWPVS